MAPYASFCFCFCLFRFLSFTDVFVAVDIVLRESQTNNKELSAAN